MQKKVLITGANRGLGLGLVQRFLESNAHVFATCRHPEQSKELQELTALYPDRLELIALDVQKSEDVERLGQLFHAATLDLLINNAGVFLDHDTPFETVTDTCLSQSFEVNVIGPVRVTQQLLPALKRSGTGQLAMMSSLMGSITDNSSGGAYGYRSSKAALNMITKGLSADYPWLTSIALHPGWVQTDMGGQRAPLDVKKSTQGMFEVLKNLKPADSGKFFNYSGTTLLW